MKIALILIPVLLLAVIPANSQSLADIGSTLKDLVAYPAVTGHEQNLSAAIADKIRQRGLQPKIDGMSNVSVSVGSGKPHRLLIANIDEPGYVVSGITGDGYVRLQRVGTSRRHLYFDQYFEGQRLTITTAAGRNITGVSAIPSMHLARGVNREERPFTVVDAYIDVGAKSLAEVEALGIQILDPVAIEKTSTTLVKDRVSAPFLSDRAGAAVLLAILTTTPASEINGSVTVAFTTQEHFARKGADRLSVQFDADEVYIVEALDEVSQIQQTTSDTASSSMPVWVDVQAAPGISRVLNRFEGMVRSAILKPRPNTPSWKPETQVVRVGVPIMFYSSPVEVIDLKHLQSTIRFLRAVIQSGVS
jgi:putative aminopeptidase FrvX